MPSNRLKLTDEEIRAAFAANAPAILTTEEACDLLRVAKSTFALWKAQGRLDGTFRRFGKVCRFWRDRLLNRYFNDKEFDRERNG